MSSAACPPAEEVAATVASASTSITFLWWRISPKLFVALSELRTNFPFSTAEASSFSLARARRWE
eukprot:5391590-Prorocentrum_lima.AAC.1